MPENNARQQIIEKIKSAENILITVSDSPSVDELSSALALTLAINKAGKRATAVASGKMPDALKFLRPEKTFENSVDSLRDFIIALSKDKADHLRYKLVGDHVKIFITPYRTIINEKDLEFEQGDFNVDFVVALGVRSKEHLDGALAAHGRIFHDAGVGVLTVGAEPSNLADLNWHGESYSSLSEMIIEIIESLDRKSLTKSVATAALTGVVAETERFSNPKATAQVMVLASKLITAGADQQLIISKIREAEEKASEVQIAPSDKSDKKDEFNTRVPKNQPLDEIPTENTEKETDGSLSIRHDPETSAEQSLKELSDIKDQTGEQDQFEIMNNNPSDNEGYDLQPEPAKEYKAKTIQPLHIELPENNAVPELPPVDTGTEQENSFVEEQPTVSQNFTPVEQRPIDDSLISKDLINPENETTSNQSVEQVENTKPSELAPVATGDEYYHPESNREMISNINNNGNPTILQHTDKTPSEPVASNIDQLPPSEFGGFPPPPPIPDFSNMPMPPELPPIPAFEQTQEPVAAKSESGSRVMADQVYPSDPSQFRIPEA